jgi:hypothetical protein
LLAVKLAHLRGRAHLGMGHIDPRERDRLAQKRRAHGRGHHPHLRPPDMQAVAVADIHRRVDL